MARQSKAPAIDVVAENHFSLFLLRPITPKAQAWIDEHIPEDVMTFGNAIVVEHRFIGDIVDGMAADGLVVR